MHKCSLGRLGPLPMLLQGNSSFFRVSRPLKQLQAMQWQAVEMAMG